MRLSLLRARRRGLSMIELMVGMALGLVVVAGALSMYVQNVVGARKLLAQARVTQDLRAATDLIARDMRRSGYWGHALAGTRTSAIGAVATPNPYRAMAHDGRLTYAFSRATEDDTLTSAEQFGFRVSGGVLQMQLGADQWQDVTDARTVRIADDGLAWQVRNVPIQLGHLCPTRCLPGTPMCPTTTVRQVDLTLTGQSVADPAVRRTVQAAVRLRNDQLEGQCPA